MSDTTRPAILYSLIIEINYHENKTGVIVLTILVSLLCIYYLSFTFIAQDIQKEATTIATDDEGTIDVRRKQQYLDSIWHVPVRTILGVEYTYQEIKETELNLGLDLQGGMHVTLEVSPVSIIQGLAGRAEDADLNDALALATERQRGTQQDYVNLFYSAFKEVAPNRDLNGIFATAANQGRISLRSTDDEILDIINSEVDNAIDRAFEILRTRIDRFGTSQPNIQRLQGTGRIQIELPGVDNPERVRKLLQGVAKLEFWEVNFPNEVINTLQSINAMLVQEQRNQASTLDLTSDDDTSISDESAADDLSALLGDDASPEGDSLTLDADSLGDLTADAESDTSNLDSLINTQISPLMSLMIPQGNGFYYDLKDTAQINRILERTDVQALIPRDLKFLWEVKPGQDQDGNAIEFLELLPIKASSSGRAPLTGEVITDARQDLDQAARPAISMQMNATGARKWKKLTGANIGRRIAIVLDNYVYSAPVVQGEIPNGNSSITGNFTIEEAQDLANILKAGTLPAPTTIVEDVVIGPTLGKVAQRQGILSILSGLAIVVLFMIAYYAKGGFVANIALAFNVFFILGILAQLGASLTLPGIAGIVLTIGMSIDANVLIFERIKEELRHGAGVKQAISSGYEKAYSSIIDANVTTFLTAIILYTLGQGPVKGFAITLMIGIACSFFSAVFITRVIIEWMSKKGDKSKISFSTPYTKNVLAHLNIDFLSKRKMAYMISGSFIALGIIALVIKGGLSMGVDFTGGRSYVVSFNESVTPSKLKVALVNDFGNAGVEVKTFGDDNTLKVTTSYLIDDESDEADLKVKEDLIAGITSFTGLNYIENDALVDDSHFTIASSTKVGATIADDIKNSSFNSMLFALIVIFLYILIRFRKWQFSLGAVVALFHDTLVVICSFAILNLLGISYEVDQVFIAAILTIIGYSINDTVVVFDRIRENLGLKSSVDKENVFNESLNNTISRTLITSATTMIVVLVLFIFGGPALKGFSFALLVGVMVGTYSSIFIATPVALDLDTRTQKKALKTA